MYRSKLLSWLVIIFVMVEIIIPGKAYADTSSLVTSIEVRGAASVTIPETDSKTEAYTATVKDQNENDMGNETVTWNLNSSVTGVGIDASGVVTVDSTANAGSSFIVVATSVTNGSVAGTKTVNLTAQSAELPRAGFGTGLQFDGASYIDCSTDGTDGTNLKLGQSFTEEVWVYPTVGDGKYHGILGYDPGTGDADYNAKHRAPGIWIYENTKIHAGFGTGSEWISMRTTDSVLTLNEWNHIAVTYDGTFYKIYVNGNLVKSEPVTAVSVDAAVKMIGMVDNAFTGSIDEVRLWKTALSQDTIKAYMYRNIDSSIPEYSNLAGYFQFDEGAGTDVKDLKNDITCSFSGSPAWIVTQLQQKFYVTSGSNTNIYLKGYDPNGLSLTSAEVSTPSYGTVTGNGMVLTYQNNGQPFTTDTITYKVTNGSANSSNIATINIIPAYTVMYDGNGNTEGAVPTDGQNYEENQQVTVLGNTGSLVKAGYTFAGWNMQTDGMGIERASSSTFVMGTQNVKLYAKWITVPELAGTVGISGTAKYGEMLTADISGITTPAHGVLTYSWKRGGTEVGTSATYTPVAGDIGQTMTVTVTGDGTNATGSLTSIVTAAVVKADGPVAPAAPSLDSKTTTSVTLAHGGTGLEFECRLNDGTTVVKAWQAGKTFSGLTSNTGYKFYARVAETATQKESVASTVCDGTTDGVGEVELVILGSANHPNLRFIDYTEGETTYHFIRGLNPLGEKVNQVMTYFEVRNGTWKLYKWASNAYVEVQSTDSTSAVGSNFKIELYDSSNNLVKTYYIVIRGDVNSNGIVNGVDMIPIRNHTTSKELITNQIIFQTADMNSNGTVNGIDMIPIRNHTTSKTLISQ